MQISCPIASIVYVFAMSTSLLPFLLSLVLVPFIGAFVNSILRFRRQKHSQVTEVPKDGLDIVYEGSNAEVE